MALSLTDFSANPRTGFRGAKAADFLQAQGLSLPAKPNQCTLQDDVLVLRLSPKEFWVLALNEAQADHLAKLTEQAAEQADCYPLFCRDSHDWLVLSGDAKERAACMAKVCGVDLRPAAFPTTHIAQTSAARMNVIIVHHAATADADDNSVFSLLFDSASHEYFHAALNDALREFA